MAGKSNKLKIKKLQINFTNRWLYTLIVFFSLIVIGVFVYATAPNPGHDITQIGEPDGCGNNQFLKWTTASGWTCANITTGGAETDPLWTGNFSNVAFINKGNAFGAFTQSFDTNVLFVDATNDRIGIGTTEPGAKLDVVGDLHVSDDIKMDGIFSFGTPTTLTIDVDNEITITRSFHKVDTRDGDELDTLTKINGGEPGTILVLQTVNAGRDVRLEERTAANQGNIYLKGSLLTLIAPVNKIMLIQTSVGYWTELSRSDN